MNLKILILTACLSMFAAGTACRSAANKNTTANKGMFPSANADASTSDPGLVPPEDATPKALVADLYKHHNRYTGPFAQTTSRARVDKYFTKDLADLIWKDSTMSKGALGAIESDPLYDAQDVDVKELNVGDAEIKGEAATVPVTFENFEAKHKVNFSLKMVDGVWRIDDIKYPRGDSLRKWLEDAYSGDAASTGKFEGKYKVGDTTCTVKQVNTGFEVTWGNGNGVETFVPKEENTFEAPTASGKPNRFAFTNDNYDSGMFYRADEEPLPVKRAK